jgi:hypothetical protein
MTQRGIKALTEMFDHKFSISQTIAARKMKCSQPYICKTLKAKTSIRKYHKKKISDRTDSQKVRERKLCGQLYRNYRDLDRILDDESYFTLKHSTINGKNIFYSSNVNATSNDAKFFTKNKFEDKLLVWIAISSNKISKVFMMPSGTAINGQIYIEQCLSNRLIPFIRNLHKNDEYFFWPDLASAHYSKKVVDYLKGENIRFLPKHQNPPNVPECRCIEDFWACLKGRVYMNGWQADNLDQLRTRINYCLKTFNEDLVQSLTGSTIKKA